MAQISINSQVLNAFKTEDLIVVLNAMIDNELNKDENLIDTDFVDECVNAILDLEVEENNRACLIPLMSSEKFLRTLTATGYSFKRLNIFAKIAVVAAIVSCTTFTANAAIEAVTGVDVIESVIESISQQFLSHRGIDIIDGGLVDDTTTTTQATTIPAQLTTTQANQEATKETTTTPSQETTTQQTTTQPEDTTSKQEEITTTQPASTTVVTPVIKPTQSNKEEAVFTGVEAVYNNFKTDYIYGEKLTYNGLTLYKVYSDGSKKVLPLEDCQYTKSVNMNVTQDVTLKVIYQTSVIEIDITIRPDEDTRGSQIVTGSLYDYLLTDKGVYLTAYHGDSTKLAFETINGHKVFAIGAGVFKNSNITSVKIPYAEKIFDSAFEGCSSLEICQSPNATHIGKNAFAGCSNLAQTSYSQNLSYIGSGAYKNTAITSITLPSGITQIPDYLCEGCAELTSVNLAGNVTSVGKYAFNECKALENVVGTENIISVDDFAFYNCEKVSFSFPTKLQTAGEGAFYFCQQLEVGSIPQTITSIGESAFAYCLGVTEITIPDCITKIPYGAFRATNAKTITLHDNITEIDDYAFMSHKAKEINLPSNLETIGEYALYSVLLRDIYFDKNVTSIGENAFYIGRSTTFHVYPNTLPLTYAMNNGIKYKVLGEIDNIQGGLL